ncbi:MAG: AzlC family ABC transporter permease [Cardiobacteriaceae bacterium]|nr:AzlC family ABC transporter permease [Cardiobacteriaceae bacterium]
MDIKTLKTAFHLSIPVLMGYIPLAMAFAVSWCQADLPIVLALLASLIVYAGSGQFLLVGLLAVSTPIISIIIATLAVNLRHIFYGLSFPKDSFNGHKFLLSYCVFALTDEAFSLISSLDKKADYRLIFFISLLCHFYWVVGTILGLILGEFIPKNINGFEFSLTALFVVMSLNYLRYKKLRPACFIGTISAVFALFIVFLCNTSSNNFPAIAICILLFLLFIIPRRYIFHYSGSQK